MERSRFKTIGALFLAAIVAVPAWAANQGRPGTINYVEGQASIGTQPIDTNAVGTAQLQPGQSLNVGKGKVEVLLTPGVFLRLGDGSSMQMTSADLLNTQVRLDKGSATVEVADIRPQNNLRIIQDGVNIQVVKPGLYGFDADRRQLRVFDGLAVVHEGSNDVKVKGGHELDLNPIGSQKAQKFDKKKYNDDLYAWSNLRSGYLAEANVDAARTYMNGGWSGTGWYWDPWYSAYTWLPGDGFFYSPFGYGFYSPFFLAGDPFFFGFGDRDHFHHHFDRDFRGHRAADFHGHSGFAGGGIHDGRGFHEGGFHGGNAFHGGGGFHGGNAFHGGGGGFGGGGFHGGGGGFGGGGFHGGGGGGHGR
ncbi:MAG TPA: hypothetical protein VE621_21850 [Bryobacteraceae bacterium]|nr:hypothetical protein [Bryobacteraceae bacterium]